MTKEQMAEEYADSVCDFIYSSRMGGEQVVAAYLAGYEACAKVKDTRERRLVEALKHYAEGQWREGTVARKALADLEVKP